MYMAIMLYALTTISIPILLTSIRSQGYLTDTVLPPWMLMPDEEGYHVLG